MNGEEIPLLAIMREGVDAWVIPQLCPVATVSAQLDIVAMPGTPSDPFSSE
jgi:hypothetical protein